MMTLALLTALAATPCLTVESDQITAKDLARAVPEFTTLPGDTSLGYAPLPGAHRGFTGADIQRFAARFGVSTSFHDSVCFEWPMHRLERPELVEAMGEALGGNDVPVLVNDYSLFPAPPGKIVFPLAGLNRQAQGDSFWRGYVLYAGDKRFNIWAKVKLPQAPTGGPGPDVVSGRTVAVLVRNGAAELKFEGQAMTTGSKGQRVTVRNPRGGRSFAAEVTGKDSVLVDAEETQK